MGAEHRKTANLIIIVNNNNQYIILCKKVFYTMVNNVIQMQNVIK